MRDQHVAMRSRRMWLRLLGAAFGAALLALYGGVKRRDRSPCPVQNIGREMDVK